MFFSQAAFVAVLAAAPMAMAKREPIVQFDYPVGRGAAFETASMEPCGGWIGAGRFPYPLKNGDMSLLSSKDADNLEFAFVKTDEEFSKNNQLDKNTKFTSIGNKAQVPSSGKTCITGPDFTSANLKAGDKITLQMKWVAGPKKSPGYQCADVVLVDESNESQYPKINYTCVNSYSSTQNTKNGNPTLFEKYGSSSGEDTESVEYMVKQMWANAPASISSSGSSLSLAGAGGIGAGVTLATVFLVLLGAWATGAIAFGKRNASNLRAAQADTIRETKSISSSI